MKICPARQDGEGFMRRIATHISALTYGMARWVKKIQIRPVCVVNEEGNSLFFANAGDTFEYIGAKFDISAATLRKFNDLSSGEQPKGGMVIYIERKQVKWLGNVLQHRVRAGETLRSIAQDYAIRESKLRSLNHLKKDAKLQIGQNIVLK